MPNFLKRPSLPPVLGSGYGPYLKLPGVRGFAEGDLAEADNSFDMLKMFMELTPEEKMRVAGPNFNEMSEEEIGMAMYDFISEGRALSGGREVDYMDPEKQELPLFMEEQETPQETWDNFMDRPKYAAGGMARSPLMLPTPVPSQRPPRMFINDDRPRFEGNNPRFNIPAPSMLLDNFNTPERFMGINDRPPMQYIGEGAPPEIDFTPQYLDPRFIEQEALLPEIGTINQTVRPPMQYIGEGAPRMGMPPEMPQFPGKQPKFPGMMQPIRDPEPVGPLPMMPPLTPMPQTPMSSPVIPRLAQNTGEVIAPARTREEKAQDLIKRFGPEKAEEILKKSGYYDTPSPVPEAVPLSIEEKRNWGVRQPRTVPEMTPEMLAILKSMPEVEREGIPPQPDEMPGMPLPRFEGNNPRFNIPAPGDPIETAPDGGPSGGPPIELIERMPPEVFPDEPEQTAQPTQDQFMERLMQLIQALQERSQPVAQPAPQPVQQMALPTPRPPVAAFNMGNASAPMTAPTMPQMFNSGPGFFTPQQRGPRIAPGAIAQQGQEMPNYNLDFSSFLRNR